MAGTPKVVTRITVVRVGEKKLAEKKGRDRNKMANTKSNKSDNSEDTMAENENTSDENTEPQRTASIDVGPEQAGNVIAAWRGIFHLFGGRADDISLTDEGEYLVKGFSVLEPYNPSTIVKDVSGRERRVDLAEGLRVLQGKEPPAFKESLEMTKWMQQYARTPGEDGKSPTYVKDAIAAYKKANNFPGRRGRPKKVIRIENLGKLDAAVISQIDPKELANLKATIAQVEANRSASAEVTA